MASDILIVDDEADIRELVAGILQDEGHGTRTQDRRRVNVPLQITQIINAAPEGRPPGIAAA